MVAVRATTEQVPWLSAVLERRHRDGLDTYDEWWEGVYRLVTGPSPEHGELLDDLAELLGPLVRAAGLKSSAPANIGVDKLNCRVPDRAIYERDTPRTSPAFLASARLVIEVLSPGEIPKEKLGFYEGHGVVEYLEFDLDRGTVELWTKPPITLHWQEITWSSVLPGLVIEDRHWVMTPERRLDVVEYRPDA